MLDRTDEGVERQQRRDDEQRESANVGREHEIRYTYNTSQQRDDGQREPLLREAEAVS
jgi:hypothetical protein